MVEIREAIVVEGRYDKNTLAQIISAPILETSGFQIMKDKSLVALLRKVAQKRGLIIFTDSDGAGFVIRNYLKSAIDPSLLKHAYIPDIPGKERRKSAPGKEGKLGVEGMEPEVILQCLYRAGATVVGQESRPASQITKQDMVDLGLSGGTQSRQKRIQLIKKLEFPEHLSSNALLQALNLLMTLDELKLALEKDHD